MSDNEPTPQSPETSDSANAANAAPAADVAAEPMAAAEPAAAAEPCPDSDDIEEAPVFTESEVEERVNQAKGEAQERFLRLMAEYENFRRRTAREREQWSAEAQSDLVKDLLPVFDSLDKAAALGADDAAALSEGLSAIQRQVASALEKNAIEVHEPFEQAFDPQFHEALTRQPSADHDPGTVLAVFEKGYTIEGRLLRAARVVVSAKPD